MQKKLTRKQALRRRRIFIISCSLALAAAIGIIVFVGVKISGAISAGKTPSGASSSQDGSSSESAVPKKTASATVINTGDILVHNPVLAGALNSSTGEYDFSSFFPEVQSYFKAADLAVINLEVTLGGTKSGKYKGFPSFNTPDSLIDTLSAAGIGMCLTANNHSYDTGLYGMTRTVQVLKEKGMPYIGTRETGDEPVFAVKNVNGVKIGMTCYTYENKCDTPGRKSLNGNILKPEANALINSFAYERIEEFYSEAENVISQMRSQGAEAIVFYVHWGEEYKLSPNQWQKTIAQKLCDLGVDVIVGGHPHVIQPVELLHASGSERTTVCLYSMGNSISNQRTEELTGLCNTGHTEDGVLFSYTFDKYSDGSVVLSAVDAVPTWVNKVGQRYSAKYTMYPMEKSADSSKYGLSAAAVSSMQKSYARTRALLEEGLTACQTALGCEVRIWE